MWYTVHRKILELEKLTNLVNYELFAKIFLANIHMHIATLKMYWDSTYREPSVCNSTYHQQKV